MAHGRAHFSPLQDFYDSLILEQGSHSKAPSQRREPNRVARYLNVGQAYHANGVTCREWHEIPAELGNVPLESPPRENMQTSPISLSNGSMPDEYSSDLKFVESQREFRDLLFMTAHNLTPSRVLDSAFVNRECLPPDGGHALGSSPGPLHKSSPLIDDIISSSKQAAWLKNFI